MRVTVGQQLIVSKCISASAVLGELVRCTTGPKDAKMREAITALVVEDDEKVRRVLRNLLEDDGFSVVEADCADAVVDEIRLKKPALVTLDVQLGPDSGFDVLREIRKVSGVPVIMVTGKDDVIDRVVGLEIGADDYITKPFHVREVLARIHAILRRHEAREEAQTSEEPELLSYHLDGLTIVPDKMEVLDRKGCPRELTTADLALFKIFLDRPNRALSRDQLMDLIGGMQWSPLDRTVDNQVARLRKKIERNPSEPALIKTVRGVGYMLAGDVVKSGVQGQASKSA